MFRVVLTTILLLAPSVVVADITGKQHGDDAPIHAAMRADKLLEAGDMDGKAVWKRILAAIDELRSKERPKGKSLH